MSFAELVDLAHLRLGAAVLYATDDFFAPKEGLLLREKPVFIDGKYTERGKWMDGWESRRKRDPGHDWCIVRLGVRGIVRGIDADTSHFLGNAPKSVFLEGVDMPGYVPTQKLLESSVKWTKLVDDTPVKPGSSNPIAAKGTTPITHVRFHIVPDGGVARLRVYGDVVPDWERILRDHRLVDLACVTSGGVAVAASDQFFGGRGNLLLPDGSTHMGDGWETKRSRREGFDWAVVRLGRVGNVERLTVETTHFRGNFPESCAIEGSLSPDADPPGGRDAPWKPLLPRTKLEAHTSHVFDVPTTKISHVRLRIYPDGGVARLRVHGAPA